MSAQFLPSSGGALQGTPLIQLGSSSGTAWAFSRAQEVGLGLGQGREDSPSVGQAALALVHFSQQNLELQQSITFLPWQSKESQELLKRT